MRIFSIFFALWFVLTLSPRAVLATPGVLTIYAGSYFASQWGPGPQIKAAFETQCDCTVEIIAAEGGLARLQLEGEASPADVIMNIPIHQITQAKASGLLKAHELMIGNLALPIDWRDRVFVPWDWSYLAFVYDRTVIENPPTSLRSLIEDDHEFSFVFPDPNFSTTGMDLLAWIQAVYPGDQATRAWQQLRPKVRTVTKGWSEAYGMFTNGEVPMVVSYSTSPAYHLIADESDRYAAAAFSEGHYVTLEVAARTTQSDDPALAHDFLAFILTPAFQEIIPTANWSYPVIDVPLPAAFDQLIAPTRSLYVPPDQLAREKQAWLMRWRQAMD